MTREHCSETLVINSSHTQKTEGKRERESKEEDWNYHRLLVQCSSKQPIDFHRFPYPLSWAHRWLMISSGRASVLPAWKGACYAVCCSFWHSSLPSWREDKLPAMLCSWFLSEHSSLSKETMNKQCQHKSEKQPPPPTVTHALGM